MQTLCRIFCTIEEAGQMLHLSRRSIHRRIADGTLPSPCKIGPGVIRFRVADLETFAAECPVHRRGHATNMIH